MSRFCQIIADAEAGLLVDPLDLEQAQSALRDQDTYHRILNQFDIQSYTPAQRPIEEQLQSYRKTVSDAESGLPINQIELRKAQNKLRTHAIYKKLLDSFTLEGYKPLSVYNVRNFNKAIEQENDQEGHLRCALRNRAIFEALLDEHAKIRSPTPQLRYTC